MDLGLNGRTALVFGGSKGLGLGTATALAAEGVSVALVARDSAVLATAAERLRAKHDVAVHAIQADLADIEATLAAVARAQEALGQIDILLNNTGGPPPGPVSGVEPAVWQAQFEAMVLSVFRITDRVLPGMRNRGWGRILTVTSAVVIEPNPALGLSNTLRSALVGWSKTLAAEVARDGITANLLLPGQIATDRTTFLDRTAAERQGVTAADIAASKIAAIPAGRYGSPEEFGAVAAFFASDRAGYVTGSMIRIDGGAIRAV